MFLLQILNDFKRASKWLAANPYLNRGGFSVVNPLPTLKLYKLNLLLLGCDYVTEPVDKICLSKNVDDLVDLSKTLDGIFLVLLEN